MAVVFQPKAEWKELRCPIPMNRAYRWGEVTVFAGKEPAGWHLSISHPRRNPTWEEIKQADTPLPTRCDDGHDSAANLGVCEHPQFLFSPAPDTERGTMTNVETLPAEDMAKASERLNGILGAAAARRPKLVPPEKPAKRTRSDKGTKRPEKPKPAPPGVLADGQWARINVLANLREQARLVNFRQRKTKRQERETMRINKLEMTWTDEGCVAVASGFTG